MNIYNLGSMNIDYVYQVDHFLQPGETLSSEAMQIFPGGKGLNQSVALGRAGAYVFHGGFSGNGSEFLIETMESSGVNTGRICKRPESLGHAIIQVDKTGQNCIMLYPGTNHMFTADYIETFLGDAQPGDILLLQNECDCLEDAFIIAHGKKLQIAFNPSPFHEKIRDLPLEYVSWWFCNEIEGAALFGSTEPDFIADNFARMYPESNLILTLGEEGSMYQRGRKRIYQAIHPAQVVDTTAAGDTFTGYFLSAIASEKSVEEALEIASCASSITVSRPGAASSIPFLNEVEERMRFKICQV